MLPLKGDGMRGLAVFISDIRNCKGKESEVKRINKELANIRSKFKGDKTFDGYQKKKYICKLLFIFLLGHDIDFGHQEAVSLLVSNKFSEKQIGYLFISILLSETSDLMKLVMQSIRTDLANFNPAYVTLALQSLANIGSKDMAEAFCNDVARILCSPDSTGAVKQCASLCLLKFLRNCPECFDFHPWSIRIVQLLNDKDLGVVLSAISLVQALAVRNPNDYKSCIPIAVSRLSGIAMFQPNDLQDYTYYFVSAPWLTVKLLKLLQCYPPCDISGKSKLSEILETLLTKSQETIKSKKVQHSNAKNAILFEAINLSIHLDHSPSLLVRSCTILGNFLVHRDTNLRYLALETLCLLASSEYCHEVVKKHQSTVIMALKTEKDVSVRQRAVDMLYAMCNKSNVANIVYEMLTYLELADYSMREEMVLKIAILSEKYALDYSWYVDTMLHLIRIAGDFVNEEVWHRVIQVIVNREDIQGYAAKTVFEALQNSPCHENMVKVGGYILGEFGNLIAGDLRSSPAIQFEVLRSKFHLCSCPTQQLLLTSFVKFANLFPEIKQKIQEFFRSDKIFKSSNVELQQRAVEYSQLIKQASIDILTVVLEEMPPFPEKESSILAKLRKKKASSDSQLVPYQPANALSSPAIATAKDHHRGAIEAGHAHTTLTTAASPMSAGTLGIQPQQKVFQKQPQQKVLLQQFQQVTNQPQQQPLLQQAHLQTLPQHQWQQDWLQQQQPNNTSNIPYPFDVSRSLGERCRNKHSSYPSSPRTPYNLPNQWGWLRREICNISWGFEKQFICRNTGVLFENDLIQIGVRSEFRKQFGRLLLFFGNKTSVVFTEFSSRIVADAPFSNDGFKVIATPMDNTLDSRTQKQQIIDVECLSDFFSVPKLYVTFSCLGKEQQQLTHSLPILLNKFIEPSEPMGSELFFTRWRNISSPENTFEKICQAREPIGCEVVKQKVMGFGMIYLPGIDPVAANVVCAGILHTSNFLSGVLARIEPVEHSQKYRLTVRTNRKGLAYRICDLLSLLL